MDNELKKTMQTSTPGPPSAINSSKENNVSQDIGVIERMAPLLPKSPSRSQSTLGKLIFNFYLLVIHVITLLLLPFTFTCKYILSTVYLFVECYTYKLFCLTSADQVSQKNQWQMDPEQETEIMRACSVIKKRVSGPRGEKLMAALRRLGSCGSSLNAKRRISIFLLSFLFSSRELPHLPNLLNAVMSSSPVGLGTLFFIIEHIIIISVSCSGSICH